MTNGTFERGTFEEGTFDVGGEVEPSWKEIIFFNSIITNLLFKNSNITNLKENKSLIMLDI